jgi:ABC-type Fe3+/spermidine/putrescine transport system ATPase subunit
MGVSCFFQGQLTGNQLQTPLGLLQVHANGTAAGQVTFAIRPEHIRLCDAAGFNTLPAHVRAHSYRGEYSEYELHVGDTILRMRSTEPVAIPEGGRTHIVLPAEHLFLVSET